MNPLTLYGVIGAACLMLCFGSWVAGDVHGAHKAELACANSTAAANAEAINQWKKAGDDQRAADSEARKADAARASKAADDAQAVADRFAAMKIAIVKIPPAGACQLSPAWRAAFNGAK